MELVESFRGVDMTTSKIAPKQLELEFGGNRIPTFETWYSENSHEKRTFGEKVYSYEEAEKVYKRLLENNFFK